ncbi:MAG: hypothetical protein MUO67_19760, partial [Anaerolineales bacterium]|nr:hypothetical protein [Anaerolineales bacterium]
KPPVSSTTRVISCAGTTGSVTSPGSASTNIPVRPGSILTASGQDLNSEVVQGDTGTSIRQGLGDGITQTAAGAGDQSTFNLLL